MEWDFALPNVGYRLPPGEKFTIVRLQNEGNARENANELGQKDEFDAWTSSISFVTGAHIIVRYESLDGRVCEVVSSFSGHHGCGVPVPDPSFSHTIDLQTFRN